MDEIISQVDQEKLRKSLKRQHYEVFFEKNNSLTIVSVHKKPGFLILYLMVFFGVMRLAQQHVFQAILSFAGAITSMMIQQHLTKIYNLTYTTVSRIAVSEDNIQLTFRTDRSSINLTPEQIESVTIDISYEANNTLAVLLLEDNMNNVYRLMAILHKSEENARSIAEDTLQVIMEKLGAESV